MKRERKTDKSLGAKLLLSTIALLVIVIVSGCSNPSEKDISSSSGETVAELQTKVSKVSSEIETETDQTQNHSEEDHNHGSDSQTDKTSSDQGMAMGQDAKEMGMGMHGKDMKMKDMPMKSKGEGMAMGQDSKKMGMGMHGKDMKMKDMPMKSKGEGMAMGQDAKGMGMQGKDMKMKDMPMKSKGGGMAMGQDAKEMNMMGMMHGGMEMKKMGDKEVPTSALPGFPGISHIYHVGATGFFLDHADHLQLSDEQKTKLESLKEASQKQQNEFQNKIEEAEKEVWSLTGSDQPDVQKILEKVKFSENLKTDRRLSFIKAVGEAASVLSTQQRELLASPKDADGDEEVDSDAHSH